jgi:SAM-dependent methyltransferase
VGIYAEQVVPRLVNFMLGNPQFTRVRAEVTEKLDGDVVELGFGSGRNLARLPAAVAGVWAVEPSRVALRLAQKRIAASPVPVVMAGLDGAHIDFPDATFDAALSTAALCTIPDVEAALRELRRVLEPGACFHFAEHGRSPDARVARWQDRLTPIQRRIAGGCHLNREIEALIAASGFELVSLRNFYLVGPKALGYMYVGRARNPGPYTDGSPEG